LAAFSALLPSILSIVSRETSHAIISLVYLLSLLEDKKLEMYSILGGTILNGIYDKLLMSQNFSSNGSSSDLPYIGTLVTSDVHRVAQGLLSIVESIGLLFQMLFAFQYLSRLVGF